MTKTQAIRVAVKESSMHRQGSGWVVTSYDRLINMWRESHEMSYWLALNRLTSNRLYVALVSLGRSAEDADFVSQCTYTKGSLRYRLKLPAQATGSTKPLRRMNHENTSRHCDRSLSS